ncbi:MAG: hypothetical protein K2I85_01465 [Alistipes sp.]|nr:hypothetical protein [Alistipes sp.]
MAFICGNGINRYAYGETRKCSWSDMLLDIWKEISNNTLSNISEGISYTEFYDVMESDVGNIDTLRLKVVNYLEKWKPCHYHKWLQNKFIEWNIPLLTTNFDKNIEDGLSRYQFKNYKFTNFYPWNVYFSKKELDSPLDGFGIWHINGMVRYHHSIRLGLSEYMGLSARVRSYLHKNDKLDDFYNKAVNWNGYQTWLHIIFNRSLCIFGLGLDENETFLRWLLIERAKYFKKFPERAKKGWYICRSNDLTNGKRFLLEHIGFEVVALDSYKDVYENIFI